MSYDIANHINILPDELLLWIFRQAILVKNECFDAKSFASLNRVCKRWNNISTDPTVLYEMELSFIENNVLWGASNLERELISDYPLLRGYQSTLNQIYVNFSDKSIAEQSLFLSNTIKLFNKIEKDQIPEHTLQIYHNLICANGGIYLDAFEIIAAIYREVWSKAHPVDRHSVYNPLLDFILNSLINHLIEIQHIEFNKNYKLLNVADITLGPLHKIEKELIKKRAWVEFMNECTKNALQLSCGLIATYCLNKIIDHPNVYSIILLALYAIYIKQLISAINRLYKHISHVEKKQNLLQNKHRFFSHVEAMRNVYESQIDNSNKQTSHHLEEDTFDFNV